MGIFREYDIRGVADRDIPDAFGWALGRILAKRVTAAGDTNVYVGRDVRVSSPRLSNALARGFEDGGVNVRLLAPGPTPLLYFAASCAVHDFPTRSGIMVTASHNPAEYNGFKMVIGGKTIFGADIMALESEVRALVSEAPGAFQPKAKEFDRSQDYIDFVAKNIRPGRSLKFVLDGGNGAGGPLGLATYAALGCEVIPLFCEPDGAFPNHHPDPTVPANLKHLIEKVRETKADFGIAYDGDGDRIGAVTGSGRIMYGDQLVLFYSREILKERPGATIISEVKSSQILYETLAKWGAAPILWKTGHSLIKAKLKETHAALAGEMSGHMFFAHRYLGFDDAIFAGAKLIEGLRECGETLDDFMKSLPPTVNTPELRVDCDDEKKFGIVESFLKEARRRYPKEDIVDIDGARIKAHGGWGLMRASNTGPVLVMRFEAPDLERLAKIRNDFAEILSRLDPSLVIPDTLA